MTIVRVFTIVISIISIKLTAVTFNLHEFGTYSEAILIISTVTAITILGMSDGVNYFYNLSEITENKRKQYISTLLSLQFLIGTFGAISILLLSSRLTQYFNNPDLKNVYYWIAFQPLLANLFPMLQNLYISSGLTKIIVIRNLIFAILRLSIFALACYVTKSIVTILACSFVCDLFGIVYFFIYLKGTGFKFGSVNKSLVKPILKYCIPVALFVFVNTMVRDIDKWVVGYLGNTDQVAIYANCSKLLPFDIFSSSFALVLIPLITRFINSRRELAVELFATYMNLALLTTLILVVPALVFSKDFLLSLYSPLYLPGHCVFVTYLLVDLVRFANVSIIFSASGNATKLFKLSIIALVLNTLGAVSLFKIVGLMGPALSTLISMLIFVILSCNGSGKILNTSVFRLIRFSDALIIVFEGVILMLIYLIINNYFTSFNVIVKFLILYASSVMLLTFINKRPVLKYFKQLNKDYSAL